jgi:nitrogen fixation protein NifU and related proteins
MYSPQVLKQFQNTKNVGELADADAYVQVDNPICGDILRMSIKVKDGHVTDVRFRARGCVAAIACGAQLAEMIRDKSIIEAASIGREELASALGGLPTASSHAAQLAVEALRRALAQLPA